MRGTDKNCTEHLPVFSFGVLMSFMFPYLVREVKKEKRKRRQTLDVYT